MAKTHWWRLEEETSTLTDSTGSLDLTATGTDVIDGVFGLGRGFDTDDHFLSVASDSTVQFATSAFTISAWFYVDDQHTGTEPRYLIYKWGDGSDNEYRIGLGASGACYVTFEWSPDGSSPQAMSTSPHTIDDGQWHHLAITRTGSLVTMYIDACEVATLTNVATIHTGSEDFCIMFNEDADAITTGVDNIEIFNTALTANEIYGMVYDVEVAAESGDNLDRTKYLSAINIRAGYNDALRFKVGLTWYTADITPGEYFLSGDNSRTDILKAIANAMNAEAPGWELSIIEPASPYDTPSLPAYRAVGIRNTLGSWEVDWYSEADDFQWRLLGIFSDLAEDQGDWYAMGSEPVVCWYATQAVEAIDEYYDHGVTHREGPGVWANMQQTQSLSASFIISHSYELANHALWGEYQGCNNWQMFCQTASHGCNVRFYYNANNKYSYITGTLDMDFISQNQPERLYAGQNLYSWRVKLDLY